MKTTDYGLKYSIESFIDPEWIEYDKKIAQSHLENFGFIIVDEYGTPIDDEIDIEEIVKMREREIFKLTSLSKHKINPYFSGMQDNLVLLRDEFKTSGSITLNHKIAPNYTVEELINNLEVQISDVKKLFRDLILNLENSGFIIVDKDEKQWKG